LIEAEKAKIAELDQRMCVTAGSSASYGTIEALELQRMELERQAKLDTEVSGGYPYGGLYPPFTTPDISREEERNPSLVIFHYLPSSLFHQGKKRVNISLHHSFLLHTFISLFPSLSLSLSPSLPLCSAEID